jgi:deoxyribodipyrimidine photo-lyase
LPSEWIHQPWAAPPQILKDCGVRLGTNYPQPVVDHRTARLAALEALATLQSRS